MAALGDTVDPDGTGDFLTLNALNSARQQDLTDGGGDSYLATCISSSNAADTTACTIDGWGVDSSFFITITAVGGVAVRDATIYRLDLTANFARGFIVQEPYTRVNGLQISNDGTSGTAAAVNAVGQVFTACMFIDSTVDGVWVNVPSAAADFINCVAANNGGIGFKIQEGAGGVIGNFFQCVALNNGGYGFLVTAFRTMNCYNCYGGGNTTADFQENTNGTLNTTTSHAADGTADTTTSVANCNFTNSGGGSEDVNITTGSSLIGAGTDDPGGSGQGSTDMNGDSRTSTWDVGADEFVAAGGIVVLRRRRM